MLVLVHFIGANYIYKKDIFFIAQNYELNLIEIVTTSYLHVHPLVMIVVRVLCLRSVRTRGGNMPPLPRVFRFVFVCMHCFNEINETQRRILFLVVHKKATRLFSTPCCSLFEACTAF